MAGSRANWENQTGEKLSSFERSKRDIAKNIAEIKKNSASMEKTVEDTSGGLVGQAIRDIKNYRKNQTKAIEDSY